VCEAQIRRQTSEMHVMLLRSESGGGYLLVERHVCGRVDVPGSVVSAAVTGGDGKVVFEMAWQRDPG